MSSAIYHYLLPRSLRLKILHKIDRIALQNKNFDPSDAILVAGSPRSGTSWVMQLVSRLPNYTTLYEPFHPAWFPETKQFNVGPRPFLPPGQDVLEIREYLQAVFSGDIIGVYPQYHRNFFEILKRINARKIIIKFVRGNRLLPWITKNTQIRAIIFLVRNPYSTIASQIRTGISGYYGDNTIPSPEQIVNEAKQSGCVDNTICNFLEKIRDKEEILAAIWALDHVIPLSFEQSNNWYFLGYEKLLSQPKFELEKVFNWLGETNTLDKAIAHVKTPSVSTPISEKNSSINLRDKKDVLSYESCKKIEKVLDMFRIYYNENKLHVEDHTFKLS